MLNKEIYQKDPTTRKLVNEGVANVNDDTNEQALSVLRYELETFVCDGQYEKGLAHILETYLSCIDQAQQPGVWISGFYGSGKSHLVKMMRALWVDKPFEDGATPRDIANLPRNVQDLLKELSIQGKRHGGLHAASGTLGAGASGSVRLALLRLVFKSVGLPEQYASAKFVMWMQSQGIYEQVRKTIIDEGYDWEEELDVFSIADGIGDALMQAKPDLFASRSACTATLTQMFPSREDVSSNDMLKAIKQALTVDGKFPLTLVVLDEVQQYIGEDSQRSIDVQEVVEACSKNIGGKMLFVGTGQTAVTGTHNLKKLEGRFTIRVELSDADVDAVIRQVILAKKPETTAPIAEVMQTNLGEISRHLGGTTLQHRQDDIAVFAQDYPILPVRRRFWENALRVLDQTGTDSQLRNQLSMIHKVIQTNLGSPLGNVVPADYIYFDGAEKLLQARLLPRKVYEKTQAWMKGSPDDQLMARACGLVFLINKVAASNTELGIHPTIDTIADLLIEDLPAGSGALRSQLPALLDGCELLMKVGEEYRIQTEESAAWTDTFQNQRANLANQAHAIEHERDTRIRKMFGDVVRRLSLTQGQSKVSRDASPLFDSELPKDADKRIYLWVRDGWSSDENSVKAEARQAGSDSSTVFIFLPKRHADDLRHQLMEFKAAKYTLDERGAPNTADGTEARDAMDTTMRRADSRIESILKDCFNDARVLQGGGSEIPGNDLQSMALEAAENALIRLYPQFGTADNTGWAKAFEKARQGAPDALKAVGDEGDPGKNPVCKAILSFIAGGKNGTDIRTQFEGTPFGWSRDAIDGGLLVLLVAGLIRAQDERGNPIDTKDLDRRDIGKAQFKVEAATISTPQRIQIRKVLQHLGINAKPNEELRQIPDFLMALGKLAEKAGGDAPKPQQPNTAFIDDIRRSVGNEQLLAVFNQKDHLISTINDWQATSKTIDERWPDWLTIKQLAQHANSLDETEALRAQVSAIESSRQLLAEPNPCPGLIKGLAQALRDELNTHAQAYKDKHAAGMQRLSSDSNWQQLEPEQKNSLLAAQKLTLADEPKIEVQTTKDVLSTLNAYPLTGLADRIAAMSGRFGQILERAAQLCEPKVQFVQLPHRTLQTEAEIDEWAQQAAEKLKQALAQGPVMPR